MKSSVVRGVAIFAAGAATAVLAGEFRERPPITIGGWEKNADELLVKVEALGYYVGTFGDGRVGIVTDPISACVPSPPQPKLPLGTVDLINLRKGALALMAYNDGRLMEVQQPVHVLNKCRPNDGE